MGRQAAAIGERLQEELAHVCKMIVLELDKELRKGTPVDTGHARRNWVPSIGDRNTAEADDDSLHDAGIQGVLQYTLDQGVLWVSNAVPYIQALNYGHSKKKPAGFVEMAIDIALATVRAKLAKKGSWIDVAPLQAEHRQSVGAEAAGNLASAYSPFGDD